MVHFSCQVLSMRENELLIEVKELTRIIGIENCIPIDCRAKLDDPYWGQEEYSRGHLPGAIFANLNTHLSAPPGTHGRHPLPKRQLFVDLLSCWGITHDTLLVPYDSNGSVYACRFWWMARWVGIKQVKVLNGGLGSWLSFGKKLSTDVPKQKRSQFVAKSPLTRTVSAEDIQNHSYTLIDARAVERFRGEVEPIDAKAGHIPGALCRPYEANLSTDGKLNTRSSQFNALNGDLDVVCYCGSGVSATQNIMAILLAGLPEPALYPGSWSEWIQNPARPISR